ncbi:UNVERIFIED_CONTAM: hypothetical protein Slati_0076800 [Sesamum latifolium]|uniref:Reverse transcriptase zinc-binding domain-containing protein n=1 Tax=Sesamum latifolium TaxID=2727402 RepID=A0AAW2Y805_9LAMI
MTHALRGLTLWNQNNESIIKLNIEAPMVKEVKNKRDNLRADNMSVFLIENRKHPVRPRCPSTDVFQAVAGVVPNSLSSSTGSSSHKPEGWSFIWSVAVPPKVRLFAWRACRDSLPTSSNLARRGVSKDGVCPWCGTKGDDLFHTLLRCHFARLAWALSNIPWTSGTCTHSDSEAWFHGMHRSLDRPGFARALLICWVLWGARNRLLFQNIASSAAGLLERIRSLETVLSLEVRAGGVLQRTTRACYEPRFCAEGIG